MRAALKRAAETLLVRSGVAAAARWLARGRYVALAYHNILPRGERPAGEHSLHLGQDVFAAQLDALRRTHEVVPLDALLAEPPARPTRPRAAITFDDAYVGAVTAGVEEVARRGLPATVFVAPAFVGGRAFWWDELADPASGELNAAVRRRALEDHCGDNTEVLRWADEDHLPCQTLPAHALAATEGQLRDAVREPGITLASHTWSHPNLTRVGADRLSDELVRSASWLRERFPGALPWLSYPYGLASPEVERAAASAGYVAAVLVSGGWVPARPAGFRRHAIPRLNVPAGLSPAGFVLRTAHPRAGAA